MVYCTRPSLEHPLGMSSLRPDGEPAIRGKKSPMSCWPLPALPNSTPLPSQHPNIRLNVQVPSSKMSSMNSIESNRISSTYPDVWLQIAHRRQRGWVRRLTPYEWLLSNELGLTPRSRFSPILRRERRRTWLRGRNVFADARK